MLAKLQVMYDKAPSASEIKAPPMSEIASACMNSAAYESYASSGPEAQPILGDKSDPYSKILFKEATSIEGRTAYLEQRQNNDYDSGPSSPQSEPPVKKVNSDDEETVASAIAVIRAEKNAT